MSLVCAYVDDANLSDFGLHIVCPGVMLPVSKLPTPTYGLFLSALAHREVLRAAMSGGGLIVAQSYDVTVMPTDW
jgi:hypothetical protein